MTASNRGKKTAGHVLEVAAFLVLLLAVLAGATRLLERKNSREKFEPFLNSAKEYEVLFLGNSHMVNEVFPMELWRDYGIASYNIASEGNTMPVSYWLLMNAFEHASPKLVVVDINDINLKEKISGDVPNVHTAMDAYPLTPVKVQMILDLMDDPLVEDFEGNNVRSIRWEYLLTLGKYHSRWHELTRRDLHPDLNVQKGAHMFVAVKKPDPYTLVTTSMQEDGRGFEYLRRLIAQCQSRGTEVLLVHLPYPANEVQQQAARVVEYIAEETGCRFLDFVQMDSIVDYGVDLSDTNSHLNPSGTRKVTDYLGRYIREHYDIADHRQDPAYAHWKGQYDEYVDYKASFFDMSFGIREILMLLHDPDFACCVSIPENSDFYDDEQLVMLLQNIARHHIFEGDEGDEVWSDRIYPLEQLLGAAEDREAYFVMFDPARKTLEEITGKGAGKGETSFGQWQYASNGERRKLWIRDGAGTEDGFDTEDGGENLVYIWIFDERDGRLLRRLALSMEGGTEESASREM